MYHTIGTSILKPGMHHKDISAGTHIQRAGIRGHIIITIHHLFNTHGPESRRYTFGISHCVWGVGQIIIEHPEEKHRSWFRYVHIPMYRVRDPTSFWVKYSNSLT